MTATTTTAPRWARRRRRLPLPPWPLDACTPADAVAWLVAADRAYELGYDRETTWARKVAKALEGGPRLVLMEMVMDVVDEDTGRSMPEEASYDVLAPGQPFRLIGLYEWWTAATLARRWHQIILADHPSVAELIGNDCGTTPADWPDLLRPREEGGRPEVALAWFRRIAWGVKVEG